MSVTGIRLPSSLRRGARVAGLAAVIAILAVAALAALAPAAAAHGRSSDATNYDSRIVETPGIDGVTWRIYGGDEYLAVENASDTEITVLGYEGEPWLRVGPDGVFQNMLSTATYVNTGRYTTQPPPGVTTDPQAEPRWEQVSEGSSWYWHDHRTHWMAPTLPPTVRADPGGEQVVQDWTVPVRTDGRTVAVEGELVWVPAGSPWPWLGAGLLASLPALAGLAAGREAGDRRLARPAAAVLAVVALLNLLHLADDLFAAPAPASDKALAAVQTALFIAVGLFGAVRAWKGGDGAFTALGVGSAAMFVGQGLLYLSSLTSSQLESLFPSVVGRLAVGFSLAQVTCVGLVAVIGTRRLLPDAEPWPAEDGSPASTA